MVDLEKRLRTSGWLNPKTLLDDKVGGQKAYLIALSLDYMNGLKVYLSFWTDTICCGLIFEETH